MAVRDDAALLGRDEVMSVQFKFAYHTGRGPFYENKMQAKQVEIDHCEASKGDVHLGPNAVLKVLLASDDGGHTWYAVTPLTGPVNFIEIK